MASAVHMVDTRHLQERLDDLRETFNGRSMHKRQSRKDP